ncbi:MAG: DUF3656 domain-containing protein [Negativicutes bacterium]|nr:DUF3656 domain-containing protein [Negativicutes bacterium]
MIELLAPVGSREALTAAIESGADAIYLGGKMFGARHYAPNFTDEELAEAVRYAHLKGVRVYVTVNTLLDNSELPALVEYIQKLYITGVDAIIVQDTGVAMIARKVVPNLDIHASTQMTVHNAEGVEFLAAHGFSRVVLARELSLSDIREICQRSPIEIEVFIHGALCISYSGQCLMSSMIGGRSGNRGKCAQPCRLPYTLVDENGSDILARQDTGEYLLSPKDFNTLETFPELIKAGVISFKIEGRMKRPEYVAIVVDTYRRAIDAYSASGFYQATKQEKKDLAQIFNRGFTTAYLEKKQGRLMISDRRPNNRGVRLGRVIKYFRETKTALIAMDEELSVGDIVEFWVKVGGRVSTDISFIRWNGNNVETAPAGAEVIIPVSQPVRPNDRVFKVFDAQLMQKARSRFEGAEAIQKIPVSVTVNVAEGKPLCIEMTDADGYRGRACTGFIAEKALKRPLNPEVIQKQVERLGNTVFRLESLHVSVQGNIMVPISEINEARRNAVEALERDRLSRFKRPPLPAQTYTVSDLLPRKRPSASPLTPGLVVNIDTVEKVKTALQAGADWIMFGGETFHHLPLTAEQYAEAVELCRLKGRKIILATPRLSTPAQMAGVERDLALFEELRPDAVSISNIGTLRMAKRMITVPLYGEFSLNIYNAAAIAFYQREGLASLTLSPELNFGQVEDLTGYGIMPLECIVHGYLTLMISEYCAVGSFLGGLNTGKCNQACLKGAYYLQDRKNERFPVVTDQYCRMHVLNAKELSMLPHVHRLAQSGLARLRIEGKLASSEHLAAVTRLYRNLLDAGEQWSRCEDRINALEHNDITRGHYFRGVL